MSNAPTENERQRLAMLNAACAAYGVEPLVIPDEREAEEVSSADLSSRQGALARLVQPDGSYTSCAEIIQAEIGAPGQRMNAGRPVDPNPQYGPLAVRGAWGGSGLYEYFLRSDGLVGDAVQTHTEILVSGQWELQMPKRVPRGAKRALKEFVAYHDAKLKSIKGGWAKAVEHMASLIGYGFAAHEIVWALDEKLRPFIYKLGYRYPGTVHEWIMDERQSELLAVQFQLSPSAQARRYMLPAQGPRPWDRRVLLQNVSALGNNWEGIAPMRRSLVLLKLRQLLLQIVGVSADIYGVPIGQLKLDPAWAAAGGTVPSATDFQRAWAAICRARAVDGPRMALPDGLIYEITGAPGPMPSMIELLNYIDVQILVPFSNEGSLLGLSTTGGAYALGEVKERDQLRTAPFYARLIADPINAVLEDLARYHMGELPEYPKLVFRLDGLEDASAWLKDVREMMGNTPMAQWPKEIRAIALEKLKLPANSFDEHDKLKVSAQQAAASVMPGAPGQDKEQDKEVEDEDE